MEYFKHYTNAHEGKAVMELFDAFDHTGYAVWFILLEMCAEKMQKSKDENYSEIHCKFSFHERLVRQKLHLSQTKVRNILDKCQELSLLSYEVVGKDFNFYIPKLLESLDRDQRRARQVRDSGAANVRLEERSKNIRIKNKEVRREEASAADVVPAQAEPTEASPHSKVFESLAELFVVRKIKPELSSSWLLAFPEPDWITQEINKAVAWENANPRNRKKDFGRFMTNWLNRGWDNRRTTSINNRAEQRTNNNLDALAKYRAMGSGGES